VRQQAINHSYLGSTLSISGGEGECIGQAIKQGAGDFDHVWFVG